MTGFPPPREGRTHTGVPYMTGFPPSREGREKQQQLSKEHFMNIQERSFSGKTFRPIPKSHLSANKKLITVITPWGQEATSTKEVFESIETQYSLLSEDMESTHPFPKMMSLTPTENNMRTAVIQTNQNIFNNINQEEYSMGFELLFATIVDNIFTFIQIGQPLILIDRPHQPLCSIGQIIDPSLNVLKSKNTINTPLPHQLLGIHEDISFHPLFFRFQPEDRLILLNRNTIPTNWFTLKREERTLDNLSQQAATDNPTAPFWLAILKLNPKDE